jgi:hypothetical protein
MTDRARIHYPGHITHGREAVVRQRRDDMTFNGKPLGPLVHVDIEVGRETVSFWLPPGAVRDTRPHPQET